MNKKDQQDMISDISIKLVTNMPYIKKELQTMLPSLLKKMNWEYVKLEYSNFDTSQYIGMDHSDESKPKPMYGASACMLIVYMKTISGAVPMHKPIIKPESDVVKMPTITGKYLNAARQGAKMSEKKESESKKTEIEETKTETEIVIENATENANVKVGEEPTEGFTVKSPRNKGKRITK
jgi:hypothetical protein